MVAYVAPKDRVEEKSTSNSQTVFALTGAIDTSYNAFSASMSVNDWTIGSVIEDGVAFASGILTYSAANQITINSTGFESKGTFSSSGTKRVFMAMPASSAKTLFDSTGISPRNLFYKSDTTIVAWLKTGAFAISTAVNLQIDVNGTLHAIAASTAITMPGSPAAGTDYAIWAKTDGSLEATSNFVTPPTTNARQVGGFHYAPGGCATGTSGGDTTPAINAYSIWDLKWRPACADPRGMALIAGRFWSDIYLCGVDHYANGTSRYGVTIADGSSPPKVAAAFGGNGSTAYGQFNWWDASEVMQSAGKDLLSYAEYSAACYGTTEGTQAGSDPVSTILTAAFTSKWGLMLSTGNLWVWGRELGGPYSAAAWTSDPASRGQYYELPNAVIFGGDWVTGVHCGSRASYWVDTPSNSSNGLGARGRCDHLHHV